MKATIGVLGGYGFIGSRTLQWLSRAGYEAKALPRAPEDPGLQVAHFAQAAANCDWLIHAASGTRPSSSARTPVLELERNLQVTLSLATALQDAPACGLIYLSSGGTVYDHAARQPATEEQPLGPVSYYGAGKAAAEMFLHALSRQYQRQVVIVRPTNVYGPGQAPSPGFGIVPTAFSCCLNGQPFTLFGDGSNVRDYLYINDLCQLLLDIVENVQQKPGIQTINAASGQGMTINEVLAMVESVSGASLRRIHQPARGVDATTALVDARLAKSLYSWEANTSLRDGLAATWDWLQQARERTPTL